MNLFFEKVTELPLTKKNLQIKVLLLVPLSATNLFICGLGGILGLILFYNNMF